MIPRFLVCLTGRMVTPFPEIENPEGRLAWGGRHEQSAWIVDFSLHHVNLRGL